MTKPVLPWIIGEPGGPSGPFYSVIKPNGNVVAMQIPDKETAKLIASIPVLQQQLNDQKRAIGLVETVLIASPRLGANKDEPEGARFIQISDTLAKRLLKGFQQ